MYMLAFDGMVSGVCVCVRARTSDHSKCRFGAGPFRPYGEVDDSMPMPGGMAQAHSLTLRTALRCASRCSAIALPQLLQRFTIAAWQQQATSTGIASQ